MSELSRREMLTLTTMAMSAGIVGAHRDLIASVAQPRTKVSFPVPAGSCDTHVHIFGDPQRYPFFSGRSYTPEQAGVDELQKMLSALSIDRVVIVHPSVYGTDNRCTLDALRQLGTRARGVAVIGDQTTDSDLDGMAKLGIRGIRLNLTQAGVSDPAAARQGLQAALKRAKPRGWFLQLNTSLPVIEALKDELHTSTVPIIIDHFGGAQAALGVTQPGFSTLVNLAASGVAYVKLSAAADQISTKAPGYEDVAPLAKALVAANPQRILWGTDWPHPDSRRLPDRKPTDIAPLLPTDDGLVLNLLPIWVPEAATRRLILVDNPKKLFGF